ncbi:hypothetical protein D1B31_18020 [Neobacillus notoginsengisoli]|uniref:Uncharacterized protein n=1 Tax=Neobacillus notoginsengisoli TaxID=1578198 RepID=A0A417YPR8_9BACI|nr:hypothetical protein [Neobacillus notoginsengisoli]RHW35985.1 hypothetical protein D1B31_18020 [Neobacillus notoginsengisoli]
MNKIFLAISKHAEILPSLKQKFPESEITLLETREQLIEIIDSSFQLIITSNEFINAEMLSNLIPSGPIIIYDSSGELLHLKDNSNSIHVYKNLNTVNSHINTMPLENKDIQQQRPQKEKSKKEKKPSSSTTEKDVSPVPSKEISPTEVKEEGNKSKPVILENYPIKEVEVKPIPRYEKVLSIRKAAVPGSHKMIGIWSPISTGISTFVVNFSIYMSQFDLDIAVVELPNEKQVMKSMLSRFQSKPPKWAPFIENYYSDDLEAEAVNWLYKGVNWFPLGESKLKWNEEIISELLNTAKQYKLVFIDFPSGNMDEHALNSLCHLDEFWILVDDNFHQAHEWKKEIHKIINEYKFPGKLIFNRMIHNRSRVQEIADSLELPLIAALPNHFELFQLNNYETDPPIELHRRALEPKYFEIATHLLGPDKVKKAKPKLMAQIINFVKTLG